jgi:ATP-dependent helicase/nuclease subunit A
VVLLALFAAVLLIYLGVLYDTQVVHHEEYLAQSLHSIAEVEEIEASRGIITDRKGRPLVSNTSVYTLHFDTDLLAEEENPNDAILRLLTLCHQEGLVWEDHLPISDQMPYTFTLDSLPGTEKSRFLSWLKSVDVYRAAMTDYLLLHPELVELPEEESAKRGIATHYLLQFCDLEYLRDKGAEAELSRLLRGGFISKADAERVRVSEIESFRRSSLFKKMLEAKNLYREFRFTIKLPAETLSEREERRIALSGREVLVQGVIDCVVENPDGTFSLYDYKTDRLSKEELSDKALCREIMKRKHGTQLSYYAKAVEAIFGIAPKEVEVYSLQLGDTLDVRI